MRSAPPRRGSPGFGQLLAVIIPLGATLALVGGAALTITGLLPNLFSGFQSVETPRLVDYDLSEATSRASTVGLDAKVEASQPTEDRAAGIVLSQTPAAGTRLRRGSEVKLTISAGIRLPELAGKSADEARTVLARAGWEVAGVEDRSDTSAPAGTVIGTRPDSAQLAASRVEGITLLVSAGNLAFGRPLLQADGSPGPPELVDGDPSTGGQLSVSPATWVELDLVRAASVAGVELITRQERAGITIHEVWVWTTQNEFRGMHTFVGPTTDMQVLMARFPEPAQDVRTIRIATTLAVGNPGWREIRVMER